MYVGGEEVTPFKHTIYQFTVVRFHYFENENIHFGDDEEGGVVFL